jgi:hypothetical protein
MALEAGESLGLGEMQITHVAIAVHDLGEAVKRFALAGYAFAPATEVAIPTRYRGQDAVAGLRFAFAPGKPMPMELVQSTGGNSTVATFLQEQGEGVQHLGYLVDSVDEIVARAKGLGIDVDWEISDKHGPAVAFLTGHMPGGVCAEIIRRDPPLSIEEWIVR